MRTLKQKITFYLWCLGLLIALALCFVSGLAQTPVQKNGQLRVCGTRLCNQYGNAIQLRGMSTHGIQWYYQCLTDASLDALAFNWGSDILRISLYVQEGGYETDPAGFTVKVTNLINEATERGMYALVDWHQLTPGDPNANLENARRFFTDIANAHKDKVNIIYDICNEPNGVAWSRIKTYADQIIPVIRAIDSDAPIFIGTHGWGSLGISDGRTAQDIVNLPVNFPNIMYTFHFYAASHGDRYLQELDWASDRLPIFVTEFGTQEASGDGANNFTMAQRYIDLMRTKKIGWTNWNFSDDFRSGAVWNTGTCSGGPWTTAQLKPAGLWVRERMLSPADDFPGGNNLPPSVNVTAPANGATFTTPAMITITANASDPDGMIARVEFFQNGTSVGNPDSAAPYSITWTTSTAGNYAITAKAVDNLGAETTSAPINIVVNTTNTLPSPWASRDIGSVSPTGSASYSSGTFTVNGSGTDIWGTSDAFHFVYQPVTGDAEITARVNSLSNTNAWAKAGVMIRESLNASSTHASTVVTPSNGIALQRRTTTGGNSEHTGTTGAAPVWLRVKRTGNSFTASRSSDGITWTSIGTTTISMGTNVYIGLAITSHANGTLATSAFSNVTVTTGTANTAPSVNITSPATGTSFPAPANITISANASDIDGSITQVVFYQGSTPIGTNTSSPYSITWSGVTAGSYSITARATDNAGATTTSSPVNITVSGGSDNCSSIPQYVENGGYVAGSLVKNGGSRYECKPYPYSGWCNGAAWAYAPGTGTYWQDAWTLNGSCTGGGGNSSAEISRELTNNDVALYPNPAKENERTITLSFETAPESLKIQLKNINGAEAFTWQNREVKTQQVEVELPALPNGLYMMRIQVPKKSWIKKYLIE